MSMRTIVNGFLATIGILVGVIFLGMNDHLKSIDEHLKSLDDKFQAVVELKGLLKNVPDLNQDIKDIGAGNQRNTRRCYPAARTYRIVGALPRKDSHTTREYTETAPYNTRRETTAMSAKAESTRLIRVGAQAPPAAATASAPDRAASAAGPSYALRG